MKKFLTIMFLTLYIGLSLLGLYLGFIYGNDKNKEWAYWLSYMIRDMLWAISGLLIIIVTLISQNRSSNFFKWVNKYLLYKKGFKVIFILIGLLQLLGFGSSLYRRINDFIKGCPPPGCNYQEINEQIGDLYVRK